MAVDKIKFMREMIKDRLGKVREQISEEAYMLYCSMVDDCSDFEELKKMADIELQVGYIAYINKNIVARLKEIGYDLGNVTDILRGFCGIDSPIDLSDKEVEREDIFDVRELIMGEDEDLQNEIMAGVIREMTARMANTPEDFSNEDGIMPGQRCLIDYYDELEAEKGEKDLDTLLDEMMVEEHTKYVEDGMVADLEEELDIDIQGAFDEIDDIESAFNIDENDGDEDGENKDEEDGSDDLGLDGLDLDLPEDEQYNEEEGADGINLGEQFGEFENSDGFSLDDLMNGDFNIEGEDNFSEDGSDDTDFESLLGDDEFADEELEDAGETDFDSLLDGGDTFDESGDSEEGSEDTDFDSLLDGDEFAENTEDEDGYSMPDFDNLLDGEEFEEGGEEGNEETDFDSLLDGDGFDDNFVEDGETGDTPTDFDSLLDGDDFGDDFESGDEEEGNGEPDFDALLGDDNLEEDTSDEDSEESGDVDFDSLLAGEDSFDSIFDSVTSSSKNNTGRSLSDAINKNIPEKTTFEVKPNSPSESVAKPNGQVFNNDKTQKTLDNVANIGKKIEGFFKGRNNS